MYELLGSVEVGFEGKVVKKSGDFDLNDESELDDLIKNIFYILQDVNSLKSKLTNSGNFIKIRLRNDKSHLEVAVGSSYIKINKYKVE